MLAVLAVSTPALTGCFDDAQLAYDGPLQLEFAPQQSRSTEYIGSTYTGDNVRLGFYRRSVRANATAVTTDSVVVNLIGPQQSVDIPITFTVDTEGTRTAVAGRDYNLIDQGPVVLRANTSSVPIRFNILPDATASTAGDTLRFVLNGSDAAGVQVAPRYSRFKISLK